MKRCRKPRLLRVPEAVNYLNGAITEGTLRQWIFHRKIAVIRIGGRVCIEQGALDEMLASGRTTAIEQEASR